MLRLGYKFSSIGTALELHQAHQFSKKVWIPPNLVYIDIDCILAHLAHVEHLAYELIKDIFCVERKLYWVWVCAICAVCAGTVLIKAADLIPRLTFNFGFMKWSTTEISWANS